MTDEQIIKALECCAKDETNICDQCPYDKICAEDPDVITNDVINLIKNQKTEIEKLTEQNHIFLDTIYDEQYKISELEKEIDRYKHIKATIDSFWETLLKLKIAKRKKSPTLEELAECISEIESEAVKEFAERLKDNVKHQSSMDFEDVDNLVQEMTNHITKVEHNSLCETETYEGRGVKNDIGQSN